MSEDEKERQGGCWAADRRARPLAAGCRVVKLEQDVRADDVATALHAPTPARARRADNGSISLFFSPARAARRGAGGAFGEARREAALFLLLLLPASTGPEGGQGDEAEGGGGRGGEGEDLRGGTWRVEGSRLRGATAD